MDEHSRREDEAEDQRQRFDPHGEIPPSSEELVEIERRDMLSELTDDIEVSFSNYKDFNIVLSINKFIRNWKPKERKVTE